MPTFPRIGDVPERECQRTHAVRQVLAPVDADDARRMRERRDLGEKLGRDALARDEQLDRLCGRGGDEILALDDEQAELVAPAPVLQPAESTSDTGAGGGTRHTQTSAATVC